jgi:hypothetical protein
MRRRVEVNLDELDQIIDRGTRAPLSESEGQKLKTVLHAMAEKLVRKRNTEKTSAVLPPDAVPAGTRRAAHRHRSATDAMVPLRLPAPAGFLSSTPRSTPVTGVQSA